MRRPSDYHVFKEPFEHIAHFRGQLQHKEASYLQKLVFWMWRIKVEDVAISEAEQEAGRTQRSAHLGAS